MGILAHCFLYFLALVWTIFAPAGTSYVTQMLPPTVAFLQIVIRPKIVAFE